MVHICTIEASHSAYVVLMYYWSAHNQIEPLIDVSGGIAKPETNNFHNNGLASSSAGGIRVERFRADVI